jgi:hypothetical protein
MATILRPERTSAFLIVEQSSVSAARLKREWDSIRGVLQEHVAERMNFLVFTASGIWKAMQEPALETLYKALRQMKKEEEGTPRPGEERRKQTAEVELLWSEKTLEIFKILLRQWLLDKQPLSVLELTRLSGTSYPTVIKLVKRLERFGELSRGNYGRRIKLTRFPARAWKEVLSFSEFLRESELYFDPSGVATAADLLRRLKRIRPRGVALGGVEAARFWDPDFDLNGLPRVDITVHSPGGTGDLSFLERLDPALRPASDRVFATGILAIHHVSRNDPLFEEHPHGPLPFADPVETLLDLYELRLLEQAENMIRHLRALHG